MKYDINDVIFYYQEKTRAIWEEKHKLGEIAAELTSESSVLPQALIKELDVAESAIEHLTAYKQLVKQLEPIAAALDYVPSSDVYKNAFNEENK